MRRMTLRAAALALLAALLAAPGLDAAGPKKKYSVRREDIVIAFPADTRHIEVARSSRVWRKGTMRTFIANNVPPAQEVVEEGKLHNETWSWYPDDDPKRSLYPGDSRAGLVPFMAHQAFGDTYKWLLYMDDDTVFFPDAVIHLLEDFDPDLPYFITDHLWYTESWGKTSHPYKAAPRCLPCHFNETEAGVQGLEPAFPNPPKGCPCTPQLLCANNATGDFNRFCDMPRNPKNTYSMHGGAGGIMSIGLMRRVGFDFMERCTKSLYSTGGDAFISICLWQAGYAFTDPGKSLFYPDLQYFDPGPEDRIGALTKLIWYIDAEKEGHVGQYLRPKCNELCKLQLEHMLSMHVRSRMFHNLDDAASFIKAISQLYEVYDEIRKRRQADAAAALAPPAAGGAGAVQPLRTTEPNDLGEEKTQRMAADAAQEAAEETLEPAAVEAQVAAAQAAAADAEPRSAEAQQAAQVAAAQAERAAAAKQAGSPGDAAGSAGDAAGSAGDAAGSAGDAAGSAGDAAGSAQQAVQRAAEEEREEVAWGQEEQNADDEHADDSVRSINTPQLAAEE